jgi:hypothetical protein
VSERPNIVLGALFGAALAFGGLVAAGLLVLGSEGAQTVGATVVAAFSACIFFLLSPEQVPFSSILIVAFSLASATGLVRTARAYRRERRLLRALPLRPLEQAPLGARSSSTGIPLLVSPSSRPAAFCAGLLRPKVVISTGLLERLDPDERAAVICHELAHARTREPLKCLLARFAAQTFFWLPALRALLDRYLLVKELSADREAIARTSRPALAGALSQVLAQSTPAGAVGMSEFAAARVDRLFEPHARLPRLFRPWQLVVSALAGGALALALAFPSTLAPEDSRRIWEMLSTMSLHGLPGMLAGLGANLAVLGGLTVFARRLAR